MIKRLMIVGLLALATGASALDVQEIKWGFNGKVVPGRLNPLSVKVYNASDRAFEGDLVLERGGVSASGGSLHQSVYVGPFATRWVQFSPYVNTLGEWRLKWQGNSLAVLAPKKDAPCIVLLDQGDFLTGKSKLPSHPAALFPASVSLTDALDAVVLDHAPDWSPLQQQAFMDWLYGGGTVHIIKDREGRYPEFAGPMQTLMENLGVPGKQSHGGGDIHFHDADRRGLTIANLADSGYRAPKLRTEKNGYGRMPTVDIFSGLKSLVRVNHNWGLIYFLIVVYMLLIGPGNYLFARKQHDYKRTIAFFVAAVAVFALLFSVIGRRGYGERTVVHSMSYARALGDGQYDVAQWMNLFVTKGNYYTVTHPSTHDYYSTCQADERVNAQIRNGSNGSFVVDIPLYSSRPLYHRAKMTGPDAAVSVVKWESDEVRLKCDGDKLKIIKAWMVHDDSVEELNVDGRDLIAGGKLDRNAKSISDFTTEWRQAGHNNYNYGYRQDNVEKDPDRVFTDLLPAVIIQATSIEINYALDNILRSGRSDRADVLVVTKTPDTFHYDGDTFGGESGYTMYHFIVRKE